MIKALRPESPLFTSSVEGEGIMLGPRNLGPPTQLEYRQYDGPHSCVCPHRDQA